MGLLTVGHSNRSLADLLALLKEAGVDRVVDVRSYPASRRHPWFNREALSASLEEAGIAYQWEGRDLGGRRRQRPEDAARHPAMARGGFRAYARHMEGREFAAALNRVLAACSEQTALMCAEADPGRCHRSMVADFLEAVRGIPVHHIMGPGRVKRHTVHPGARVNGTSLRYDRSADQMDLDLG